MSAKIAVTGATGFIGRHVLNALSKSDADVTVATRALNTMVDLPASVNVVALDIGTMDGNAFKLLGYPDVVLHLAWNGLPNYRARHHFEEELPRQYRFLRGLVEYGLPALVVAGTCLEYGMQSGPLSENLNCNPANPYALAKHTLHQQLTFLNEAHNLKLTWARLFYTYGVGQADTSLWAQLHAALDRGDRVFNMSGGEQLRDFLPVDVMAKHLADLALNAAIGGTVNVCSGSPQSVRKLVERWIADAGKKIDLNLGHHPYPDYEPMAFWGTADKLQLMLSKS